MFVRRTYFGHKDRVHKPQLFKREENRSGIEPRSFSLSVTPYRQAKPGHGLSVIPNFPQGQTGSRLPVYEKGSASYAFDRLHTIGKKQKNNNTEKQQHWLRIFSSSGIHFTAPPNIGKNGSKKSKTRSNVIWVIRAITVAKQINDDGCPADNVDGVPLSGDVPSHSTARV